MLWIVRTGSPWRDLPPSFGNWNTVFKRYRDWVKADVFARLFEACSDDAGHGIRHGRRHHRQGPPPRTGRKRGTQSQAIGRSKGGMTTKILALTDALGNLVRFVLLPGHRFDTVGVAPLIDGLAFGSDVSVSTLQTAIGDSECYRGFCYALSPVRWDLRRNALAFGFSRLVGSATNIETDKMIADKIGVTPDVQAPAAKRAPNGAEDCALANTAPESESARPSARALDKGRPGLLSGLLGLCAPQLDRLLSGTLQTRGSHATEVPQRRWITSDCSFCATV